MNVRQALENCLNDWKNISKLDFCILNQDFSVLLSTGVHKLPALTKLEEFTKGNALCKAEKTVSYYKVYDQNLLYLLLIWGTPEQVNIIGELAVCQVESLWSAYAQKTNKNAFIQQLLTGNISTTEMHNQAKKMHIANDQNRLIFQVQTQTPDNDHVLEIIRNIFSSKSHDMITSMSNSDFIIIHDISIDETHEDFIELATILVNTLESEIMIPAKVSLSNIAESLSDLANAYKESCTAMEIGKIFYMDSSVYSYNQLGIGRLIYQLPVSVCELFINEIYQNESLDSLDEETLNIIRTFFANNLNLSETSRNLYVHRNSLVYRFEKIQKKYGLDLRTFEDALTFKISMMVTDYIRHESKRKS